MRQHYLIGLATLGAISAATAQSLPPAPNQGGPDQRQHGDAPPPPPPGMPGEMGPGMGHPPGMGMPGMPPGAPGAAGMPGMPGRPNQPPPRPIEGMRQYLELVDKYTTLAKDPSAAGISAVVQLAELTRQQGPAVAIERLNKLLAETKDTAVQRAIRLHLIDLYKSSGQTDKAIEQAEILIKG